MNATTVVPETSAHHQGIWSTTIVTDPVSITFKIITSSPIHCVIKCAAGVCDHKPRKKLTLTLR